MASQRNKDALQKLVQRPGNNVCADCRKPSPEWAALPWGIFLCVECCSSHRSIGTSFSKTKSILLDNWTDDEVAIMMEKGNLKVNDTLEANYHAAFKRPKSEKDVRVLRDQWVIAKYQRKEFCAGAEKPAYMSGHKRGFLYKKAKERVEWKPRLFELSEKGNYLRYFEKEQDAEPCGSLPLTELNAVLVDDIVSHPNGMVLMFYKPREDCVRNIYVYAEKGPDIVEWFLAIRHSRANLLGLYQAGLNEQQLSLKMSRDFVKAGILWKTGPDMKTKMNKRWFLLDQKTLYYYKQPLDPLPLKKKAVTLGSVSEGYGVEEGSGGARLSQNYPLLLRTPSRTYQFAAENDEEQRSWVEAFQRVLRMPPGQDETGSIANGRKSSTTPVGGGTASGFKNTSRSLFRFGKKKSSAF
ncbi:arf-GAP with dual PH domain-containing protein 1-like isoform X2 [Corticium candelabrum]|uniref:arf-GAP with dual PH domain-containing protein 1-like isoform X2 n=1 Tax=Corticium candelabrum TaxID=121492 RepID=UPI002E34D42F|nr:arf-GAP with dual PH domain-containing protein 1-like isoform X2 [Corticium candelabrum]